MHPIVPISALVTPSLVAEPLRTDHAAGIPLTSLPDIIAFISFYLKHACLFKMLSQSLFDKNQITAFAGPAIVLAAVLSTLEHSSSDLLPLNPIHHLIRRSDEAQCSIDLSSPTACRRISKECPDFDGDGLIPYLRLYACTSAPWQPLVLAAMALWLLILFASMATAAGDFLALYLEYLVRTLRINENLAGVTLFAFGNGCTDLFSTLGKQPAVSLVPLQR